MSSTDAPPEGPSGPAERVPQPQEDEPPEPQEDKRHVALLQALESELGDSLVGSELRKNDLWVRVRADSWRRTGEVCRSLGFDYFCFLSGIDWMPHTWPNPKAEGEDEGTVEGDVTGESPAGVEAGDVDTDPGLDAAGELDTEEGPEGPGNAIETGYAGGDTRYQVLARVYSVERKLGFTLKADLDSEEPRVHTWSGVYPGADWHERETWEMYGFDFVGHPNLIHLYLPGEFEGFPLRKDFPLLAREVKPWPGLVDPEPMPEVPETSEAEE